MARNSQFAYLQARLQARHGERPSPDDWRLVEASADLSHFLDAVSRTSLKRWIGDLNHEMEPEAIERQLRATWREVVSQTAGWCPESWRKAVEWLRWLPDLPAIENLVSGGKLAPWMRHDPVMRDIAFDELPRRSEALAESEFEPLTHTDRIDHNGRVRTVQLWIEEWQRRCPEAPDPVLTDLLETVLAHVESMRGSDAEDGRALRNLLATHIARLFRRGAGTASAVFAHLLLDGLELERLRAGIISRRLMPERSEGRSWA